MDLATPLNADTKLELVKENDPEALKVVRHSAAHVLATAVLELFPETKLGHGPATDAGFFYDFYREKPFTPDDLAAIEKKMAEVVARDEKFVREYEPREQALEEFERDGDFMKTHFVTKFTEPGSQVSFYRNGKFVDFCRGPHVPSTGRVKAVKVTSAGRRVLAGRREESAAAADLWDGVLLAEGYGRALRAAGRGGQARPSRAGQAARSVQHSGTGRGGLIFWHPKGGMIRKVMEDWMRDECLRRGYSMVYHSARDAARVVEGERARGLLLRQHVHADGTG